VLRVVMCRMFYCFLQILGFSVCVVRYVLNVYGFPTNFRV
jgi:hypothetical protein